MPPPACAHLHVHSEYSLLDGAASIAGLVERAAAYGQPALGLTDHGVMNGAIELYKAARAAGIKPIIGCEVYLVDDHAAEPMPGRRVERNHLTLLAASNDGYRNLVKLSSAGFLEGLQRGRPCVDIEQIARYGAGVIALTGCLASRLCSRIADGRLEEGRAHVDELLGALGAENVYFEVQRNGLELQERCNEQIVRIAREVGRPLVATGDVHYLGREDHGHHAALLCVQTKSTLAEPKLRFETNEFYLKDCEEMAQSFAQWPEALASTLEIAERVDVEIELGRQLIPAYEVPAGETEGSFLRARVEAGLRERYGDPPPAPARERMEMELAVIDRMGFNAYFLIVWDFVDFAKRNGIAVGPGRGSAAGSIVAYSLRITDVDPLAYDLMFERFLNPERVSMPDIDIDFSVRGRERVMQYVIEKYGRDAVAQIVTFGRMLPRAATRDAARVLGHDYAAGDRLAKLIPENQQGRAFSFEECLVPGQALRTAYDEDALAREIIDQARGLEGIVRNASLHAAAVVIADRPLTEIVPLQLADDGVDERGVKRYRTVTQYSMKPIEDVGLLKMDFLGLRNLDVIEDTLAIIERSSGERIDIATLPLDDAPTYEMLARGDSAGVFQFESEGMRDALRRIRPTLFDDLVALVALYRPGAMDQIPNYARGKRSPETINYADERLRPILESSMGVILYQEQAMRIAKEIAGFSGAKADDLRKAIGKKSHAAMAALKPDFITGARASGTSEAVIDALWATNERSADYSFNRSHAACYALIAYRTAWLKANHPAEFMAALISSVMSTKDRVPEYVARAEEMGLLIKRPDVNLSGHEFSVDEGSIRFGLDAVKGVGYQAVESILEARERGGPFASLWDFCERVDSRAVNRKAVEALVKAGALSSTGDTVRGMLEVLEHAQSAGAKAQQDALLGQGSIFDLGGELGIGAAGSAATVRPRIPTHEFEQRELLAYEKEATGLFLSTHPLREVREALRAAAECSIAAVATRADKEWVTVGGIVTATRKIRTRAGSDMMLATLDDLDGQLDVLVFAGSLEKLEGLLAVDEIVLVRGRVDQKEGERTTLVAQSVEPFRPDAGEVARAREAALEAARPKLLHVRVGDQACFADVLADLRQVLGTAPGESEVVIELSDARRIRLGEEFRVQPSATLRAELEQLLGGPARLVS